MQQWIVHSLVIANATVDRTFFGHSHRLDILETICKKQRDIHVGATRFQRLRTSDACVLTPWASRFCTCARGFVRELLNFVKDSILTLPFL